MKILLTLIAFFAISTLAYAQQNLQDVVYLKNGGIIRGMITEQIPNKTIKIETADRNVFVYQMDEIEKIMKEPGGVFKDVETSFEGLKPGYQGFVETGIAFGDFTMFKLNIINGYRVNPYFSMGLGVGIRFCPDFETASIPIFADFRTNLLNKKVTPYLGLAIGYSYSPDGDPLTRGLI